MTEKSWKTRQYFSGPSGAHRRSVYKASGCTDRDFDRPLVAVVNTNSEVCPGHYSLNDLSYQVKAGVLRAGGTPLEFGAISQCGTTIVGLPGERYDLPARDLLAFDIETIVETQLFDGVVVLVTCDKTIPGALLALARLDLPSVIVPGGPMLVASYRGRMVSLSDLDEMVFGTLASGNPWPKEINVMEDVVCPSSGACPIMGTANTMQCLAEAGGMTLPFASTAYIASAEKRQQARLSGAAVMEMINRGISARKILNIRAIMNMLRTMMAIGGGTNSVVHLLALAQELELGEEVNLDTIGKISAETPCICNIKPTGEYYLPDLHLAGGIPAVLSALRDMYDLEVETVSGKRWGNILAEDLTEERIGTGLCGRSGPLPPASEVITDRQNPVLSTGGINILRGNLAPIGGVCRQTGVQKTRFSGPAKVYNGEQEALEGLARKEVKEGDVLIVRYAGPRGGPGMPDIYGVMATVCGLGLQEKVAVLTDGRFSGFSRGFGICQISPEAAVGGPLAFVKNGDRITIDLEKHEVVGQFDLEARMARGFTPREPKNRGILALYAKIAEGADKGALLR